MKSRIDRKWRMGQVAPGAALITALVAGLPGLAGAQTPDAAPDPAQLAYVCEPAPLRQESEAEQSSDEASPSAADPAKAQLSALIEADPDNPVLALSLARCLVVTSGYSAAAPELARAAALIEARASSAATRPEPPTKRSGPNPQHPEEAWEAGVFGVVAVETTVDQNGRVQEARVVESRPTLDEEAERTVKRWRFDMPASDQRATDPFVVFLKFGPVVELTVADLIDVARVSTRRGNWSRARDAVREAQALNQRLAEAVLVTEALEQHAAGFVKPRMTRLAKPAYTSRAMRDQVEGSVHSEALIRADGTVQVVRILQGLDRDLDRAAVNAVERSRLVPATHNGVGVETLAVFVMSFRIHY